ncbi:hypothetical protein CDZ96_10045 [Mameliella alba]|nr:hypothetical protein CDZ96_10045 [Mameliella alba]
MLGHHDARGQYDRTDWARAFLLGTDPVFLGTLRIIPEPAQTLLCNQRIDEEQLEQRNPVSVADVFRGESSVAVNGGAAIAQKVVVNGIEESLLSVTIDAARKNKSAFHHTGNILFDPALLKSVEGSEGIGPADAGPNALAGGLADTTKDARDFLEPGERLGGLTSLRGGSNGQGFRRLLTLFGQEERFEWLLSGTRQTGDDYKDGDGKTVAGTEADLSAYVLKFSFTSDTQDTQDTGSRSAQAGPGGILSARPEVVGPPSVFAEGLEVRLGVENLFDQTYASRSADDLGLGNVVPLNEPGRTISLTANLRF